MDEAISVDKHARRAASAASASARLTVPGMGNDHSAGIVSASPKRLAGIAASGTKIADHRVIVRFAPTQTDATRIRRISPANKSGSFPRKRWRPREVVP
jgi:hypothetical protein